MSTEVNTILSRFYPKYEPKIHTITSSTRLINKINPDTSLETVFHLIPITRTNLTKPKDVNEIKLPYPGKAGMFMTCCYDGVTRGIVKKKKQGKWSNSVFVDVSTSTKNINVSINRDNLNITGVKILDEAIEASSLILDALNFMNLGILLIHEEPELFQRIAHETIKKFTVRYETSNVDLDFTKEDISNEFPFEGTTEEIMESFVFKLIRDYENSEDARKKIKWVSNLDPFLEDQLEIDFINLSMIKIDINMPNIKLNELNTLFKGTDFLSVYHPAIKKYLKVEWAFEDNDYKKSSHGKHTINVESHGKVSFFCTRINDLELVLSSFIEVYEKCLINQTEASLEKNDIFNIETNTNPVIIV